MTSEFKTVVAGIAIFVLVFLGLAFFFPLAFFTIFFAGFWLYFNRPSLPRWVVGNKAFAEHQKAEQERLKQEREDFAKFEEELASTKDKAEFEQFQQRKAAE